MALVDYSSSASEESDEPPKKRRRARDGQNNAPPSVAKGTTEPPPAMPALPATFHDLYASNVRHSVTDDPSLHQGRKRLTPHVPGNWPSHVYVEWVPTPSQHDVLHSLLLDVEKELNGEVKLHKFITSELGAPLPLHISLSRPVALQTSDKDAFLTRITDSLSEGGVKPFNVVPRGLAWYKSPDSDRTFLILRVSSHNASTNDMTSPNPELMALLKMCNSVVSMFKQPVLYQASEDEAVGTAFHVSVAWCFGLPMEETSLRSLKVLKTKEFADVRTWDIDVSSVKVKVGNVVKHVGLSGGRRKAAEPGFDR